MKHWTPPALPQPWRPRRRIPSFHPVPVGPRRDGWTVARQAALIGYLVETRSVVEACRRIGMGRESAYRLRARPGAAGFVAAWDTALGKVHASIDTGGAKSTGLSAAARFESGLIRVVMRAGRYAGYVRKPDDAALLQHLAQLDRSCPDEGTGQVDET